MSKLVRCFLACTIALCVLATLSQMASVAHATTNMGYYDQEDESNDTPATADVITSERLMRGSFPSTSDNYDYYKINIIAGSNIHIQLSTIPAGCDYDLALYNSGGTSLASSVNSSDVGEWISYSIGTTGTYYIRVSRYSGSSVTQYRLYAQTSGSLFNHSYYITNVASDDYMYWLGRDHTNSLSGLVFLSFGEAEKKLGEYGVNDLGGHWANMSRVKMAVEKFIQGYNANPYHTANVEVVVAINNCPSGTAYQLPASTVEYSAHGVAFKNMIVSISTSGHVTAINGGVDAEMDYNTPSLTRAWVDGFSNASGVKKLYNFGDHAGRTDDFSSETNPSFNNGWTADDIWYISYGNACSYCVPEIYISGHANQWAYQKKWAILHSRGQAYEGVMSTNGWDGLYKNQESYDAFYGKLQGEGVGESLENRTWIALASQP